MAVGTLTVDIVAKLAGIQGDLGKVSRLAEQSAKKIEKSFADAGKTVKDVFSALGASLTVGAAVQFVQQMVDAQDALVDLSKSTAISIETLSGLGFAAKTTGGDLDSIAASINKLQVNIGKDPEKYKQLGINAKDGYEAFKQLADIFVAIEEPEKRAAVAAEALGKSWAGAAPALSEGAKGFEALVSKGKDVSGVTAESAAKAAELNAKLDLLKARAGGAATELVNSLVPSLDRTAARMEALAAQGQGLQAVFAGLIGLAKLPFDLALGEIDTSRAGQIKDLENKLQSLETKAKRATGQGGFLGELVFGKPGEFDQQIAVTKNQIEALKKFSKDAVKAGSDEAAKKPPSDAAIKQFVGGGGGGGAKSGSRAGKAIDDGARLVEQLRDQIRATQDLTEVEKLELAIADGKYKTATAANLATARGLAAQIDVTKRAAEAAKEAKAAFMSDTSEGTSIFKAMQTPSEKLNATIERLVELEATGAISMETFGRAASKAGEEMQGLETKTAETADTLTEFARSAAQNMQSAFADFLFDPFSDGTDSMLKKFGETIKRMIAEAASAEIMKRLFGDFGSKGGGGGQIGGWVGSLLSSLPSFDVGTPYVPRDMVAKVHQGERIVPAAQNRSGGGGQSISVVINMAGGSSGSDLRQSAGDIARRIGQTVSGAARYA
jgi:hypothetical protein